MIILDTNVVSEPMKPNASPVVVAWLDRQIAETLYLTATSLSELLVGIATVPDGRRRRALAGSLHPLLKNLFGPRILPFDESAAMAYAELVSRAKACGHTLSVADGQIAAIAHTKGFAVATRDQAPFLATGVAVIDPWVE